MLTLRGVEYGNIFCAPGALGFFGEGYPYHKYTKLAGMTWKDCSFVSKTIVYPPRAGNMPLKDDKLTPKERLIPRSIVVKPWSGHVLNAVGLSGPGAEWALNTGRWQQRTDNFMISFMSVAPTREERLAETRQFADLMKIHLPGFTGNVAIQVNRGCPNSGHIPDEFFDETDEMLDILSELGVPIVVNFNPLVPIEILQRTSAHPACDAVWIANTIPWGEASYWIDWQKIFQTPISPLSQRDLNVAGNGGLSGPACLAISSGKVHEARQAGITKPIVAGNGIQRARDVAKLKEAGADAVAIGVVAMLRPWRMKSIIRAAQNI